MLLHGYELKVLNDAETRLFEEHLMTCTFCLEQIRSFQDEASVLLNDSDAQEIIAQAVEKESRPNRGKTKSIWSFLWPNAPVIFRPALLYPIIILLLIPAVLWFIPDAFDTESRVQTIHLSGMRSQAEETFSCELGFDGIIVFVCTEARSGEQYDITVYDKIDNVVINVTGFNCIDLLGTGYLLYPSDKMSAGDYKLQIAQMRDGKRIVLKEYKFSIIQ
ncbi:MAG: hypothetical protein KAR42_08410 [candidate division Zixibacteria bacterium]|nr:hypothetical protein [candidate division Zixibacteria bacterium]